MVNVTCIKKDIQLRNWTEMIKERNNSEKSVTRWCKETGINVKTYYYRLSKVREAMSEGYDKNSIVPIGISEQLLNDNKSESMITIRKNDIELESSENIFAQNLAKIMRALQC